MRDRAGATFCPHADAPPGDLAPLARRTSRRVSHPVASLDPTRVARLSEESSDDQEKAWAAVIAALMDRYDIDLADDDAIHPPSAADIEAT